MNIADLVRRQASARPGETAFVCGDRAYTWRETDRRSDALAAWLAARLDRGARVAILSANCHRYWETHFACAKAGVVSVPINHRLVAGEVAAILEDVGASALILGGGALTADATETLLARIAFEVVAFPALPGTSSYEDIANGGAAPGVAAAAEHETNVIGYTSGTTGRTKGAMLSHHCSVSTAMWFAALFGIRAGDVFLACMPAYVYRGGGGGMAAVLVGARTVVLDFDASAVLDAVETHRVTHLILAPAMVERLLTDPDLHRRDLRSLRGVFIGGAPTSVDMLVAFGAVVGDVLGAVYGMTEATGIASTRWSLAGDERDRRRLRSVGRPSPLVDLRLVTEAGHEAAIDEPGEILVRGDSVMEGYWGDETGSAFRDGWFPTGDVAVRDVDGFVYIVDRRSDVVNSGGFNVYSVEVEQVLASHPGVAECCVVGAPDPEWGEAVCAVIVRTPGGDVSADSVDAHCADRLARFKRPRRVVFVDELPRNAMGKVNKKSVRASLWEGRERQIAG